MDHARLVRELERIEELAHHPEDRAQIEGLLGSEVVLELFPLDVLHHDVGELALGAEVVHLHDVRVVEPRHGAHLALEALLVVAGGGFVEIAREDGLDRDAAVERGVVAVVDQAHRAFAEHAADLVAAKRLQFTHGRMITGAIHWSGISASTSFASSTSDSCQPR